MLTTELLKAVLNKSIKVQTPSELQGLLSFLIILSEQALRKNEIFMPEKSS